MMGRIAAKIDDLKESLDENIGKIKRLFTPGTNEITPENVPKAEVLFKKLTKLGKKIEKKMIKWDQAEADAKTELTKLKAMIQIEKEKRATLPDKITSSDIAEKSTTVKELIAAAQVTKEDLNESNRNAMVVIEKVDTKMESLQKLDSVVAAVKADWNEKATQLEVLLKTIDVCLMLDLTGSMDEWLEQAKTKLKIVLQNVQTEMEGYIVRAAFVGYRDFGDEDQYVVKDFDVDLDALIASFESQTANGGGDTPEDVAGGLRAARDLNWVATTRLIVHIADAPPHGERYCVWDDVDDDHPNGSNDLEGILKGIAGNRIDYWFVKINSLTDLMITEFKAIYSTFNRRTFSVWDIGNNPPKFSDCVKDSITASSVSSAVKKFDKHLFSKIADKFTEIENLPK